MMQAEVLDEHGAREALLGLSKEEHAKLELVARLHSKGRQEWQDLLQSAFLKVLTGERKCPIGLNMMVFLSGVMRSLGSSHRKSLSRNPQFESIEEDESRYLEHEISSPSPEDEQASTDNYQYLMTMLQDELAGHENAFLLVESEIEGLSATEIRELLELNETEYASLRKLVRRKMNKLIEAGRIVP